MKQYLQLMEDILTRGEPHTDRTGVGTLSLFGYQMRIPMSDGSFPLLTTKHVSFRLIVTELLWFLSGSTDAKVLQSQGNHIWDEWATASQCARFGRDEGDLGPIYGELWRAYPSGNRYKMPEGKIPLRENDTDNGYCDQITQLIDSINRDPGSRRLIVTGWHPYWQTRVTLPPCHTLWQIKWHSLDNSLSLHLYARSIDCFLGLPFNIASYALLLRMICQVTNKSVRDLIISFGDVHIYNNHLSQVKEQLSRSVKELPLLQITPSKDIFSYNVSDFIIYNYNPWPRIPAPVAV